MMARLTVGTLAAMVLVACNGDKAIDQSQFEPVYRASANLEQAIDTRVNLPEFDHLVREFGTETKVARTRVKSDTEDRLVTQYESALTTLQDALVLWRQSRQSEVDEQELVRTLLDKYNAKSHMDAKNLNDTAGRALGRGKAQLQYAGALYNGKDDAIPPPAGQ
jgi:hypothetical protein